MFSKCDKDKGITCLISEGQIQSRITELGSEISKYYEENDVKSLVVICVLKGAFVFCADLIRWLDIPEVKCEFVAVSSYGNRTDSKGVVELKLDLSTSIVGKHILLVEDIADTRLTLQYLKKYMGGRDPASMRICAFLDKPARTEVEVPVDFTGFEIEDKFVVGYGLDFDQRYRNLPYIGVMQNDAP